MIRNLVLATLLVVAVILVSLAVIGLSGAVEVASADSGTDFSSFPVIEGTSIVADNHYSQNGNYDIHYDGQTCFRWINDRMPVVVSNPKIITYTNPIDDSSLLNIIACES
jgi:hypothetical protein